MPSGLLIDVIMACVFLSLNPSQPRHIGKSAPKFCTLARIKEPSHGGGHFVLKECFELLKAVLIGLACNRYRSFVL